MVSVFSFYSTISIAFELFLLIQKRGIHCLIPESNLQTKSWDKLMSEKSFWNFKEKQKIFQSKIWSTKFVVSIYLTAQRWCFFCFFFFSRYGVRGIRFWLVAFSPLPIIGSALSLLKYNLPASEQYLQVFPNKVRQPFLVIQKFQPFLLFSLNNVMDLDFLPLSNPSITTFRSRKFL